ncbi:LysM peptidoglycan-binding domain-containing protein [Streptococcus mitis]|uniref:LysM domain protein n=1 Tax=Streptococcus mitis SK1073 TaxID=1008452 RepID=F9H8U2_STRMT|nr:LysM domain-containing protein [Streptococcus mitis]EGP70809.1 LysM domain protein [Streptococcus mitis SK1073]
MRQTNVRGSLSLRGFRKLRTGAIVATGVILLGLGFLAPTVSASEQDGVWVARTVAEVKDDIQKIDNLSHYTIKWGDTLSAISGATGISVDSLVEINRIANRDLIFANNQLYFSEEAFLKDGNTEVKRQQVSIDNSGSRQSYEVETKTDTVTGEQTTTVKQTTPVVVETPSTPAPKAEEPATPTPAQPVEDQPAAPGATETPTPAQPVEDQPAAPGATETPTPAQPAEETPASGATETPTPAQPAEETPASGATETPTPAQPAEETPASGATETPTPAQPVEDQPAAPGATETPTPAQPVEDQPAAPGATETPTPAKPVEDQPAAPGATETPTPAQPVEDQPAAPGATEQPTPSQPAENQPAGSGTTEDTPADSNNQNNPTEPKDDVEKGLEENDSELESRKNIKLEEIESSSLSSSEKEAAKLNVEEYTKKAKEAMKQAKTTEDQAAVVDNYSDDLAKINTPGVDQGKPDYTNSGLSGNGPAGTHIGDNNVIGHGNSTPENTAFRNAPVYQPRVTRRARSVDEPQNKVSIYYNFDGMKDIPGFFDDLGGKNEVDIPKDVSGDALKSILKARIDKKKAELERKGYKIADEYFVGIDQADATHYDYVVTFTKEKTGTTGFRIAPEVQVRAKKVVKRDLSNKTKQINIYYNLKALKDIAGALGELGGENMLTVSGDVSKEDLKRAIEEKTKAQIEKLKKQGFTVTSKTDLDQIVEGGDNYDYVIEFTKEAKTQPVGTTGFRMAPAVQPRASRNRRSLEQPAPQKVKVNVFYNFDKMKDIAGFLGDINGTSLEIAEGLSTEQVKAAVKSQVDAKKEELSKRGYTFKEDYVYQANGKDYNYVVTFSKAAK